MAFHLLLLKCIFIVIRDPLIIIPGNPLDTRFMVPGWLQIIFLDNILNLLIVKNTRGLRTWSRIGTTRESADTIRYVTGWIRKGKRAAILADVIIILI